MPRLRSIIRVILVGILGGAIGYFIGALLDDWQHELAVAGFLFGALTEMWHITTQRRWFIVGLLAVLYVVSYIQGGIIALLAALAATTLTFILSAVIVRHLYPSGEWEALVHHLRLALGMTRGFLIVEDAKITVPKDKKGPLMGPHELIVKPMNALVLERGKQQTRIVGPTRLKTDPFEYPRKPIPIGPQQTRLEIPHVLSSDHVPVTVTLCATYGIDLPDAVVLGKEDWEQDHADILQYILLHTPDWARQTQSAIEAAARVEFHKMNLDQLLDPSQHAAMQKSIENTAFTATTAWKVKVKSVMIENVQPPTEIKAARTSMRVAIASGEIHKQRAVATHDALMTLADAYKHAKENGMSEDDINRFLLREVLETLFQDPANRIMLSPELNSLLQSLRP